MTPGERARLAAVEQQLADVSRELRATRAHLQFLRQLLAEDDLGMADRVQQDAERILDTISRPSKPTGARPKLRLIEGGLSGERPHAHGRDRHGLRAV